MNRKLKLAASAALVLATTTAMAAEITFYEREGFRGREYVTHGAMPNLPRMGFHRGVGSLVVRSGQWEVCEDVRFDGHCTLLRPGSYESLDQMGIDGRIASLRPLDVGRRDEERRAYRSEFQPDDRYRRHSDEEVFEVPVASVHAVVGPPEQRCWVERERVTQDRPRANVGGAIAGAIIGGIIGHQIGGGTGRDIATAGGAVAGGAIGANAGRGGGEAAYDRDIRRCENVADTTPDYWDVTYDYRGIIHHVQMTSPPGPTILVNREGEPRV